MTDDELLPLNDWLGRRVRLLVLVRIDAPDEPPPPGPAPGWHVALGREARLGRPSVANDFERQLDVGTYTLGDSDHKLLLEGLPCERVLEPGPNRLAFCLPGSAVWLQLELLPDEGE